MQNTNVSKPSYSTYIMQLSIFNFISADSKKRAPNWPKDQMEVLGVQYFKYKAELDSKLNSNITAALKSARWATIADEVSAVGPDRTPDQCRKKIMDSKSSAKKSAAQINNSVHKTGGGPPSKDELSPLEAMMVAKMPKVNYEGIPGYKVLFTPYNMIESLFKTSL